MDGHQGTLFGLNGKRKMPAVKRKLTNKSLKEKIRKKRKKAYKKFGVEKNTIWTGKFVLRFENLFSRERLFPPKQTNITEFFSKVGLMY